MTAVARSAVPRRAAIRSAFTRFTLFDTPIGSCGICWGPRGILTLQLPEEDAAATCERMLRRYSGAQECAEPDSDVAWLIRGIAQLLNGTPVDFADVRLDMTGVSPFYQRVYAAAQAVPPGTTRTYGEIARAISSPMAARAVGQALGRNPFAIVVPCHRVVAAGGKSGGFSAWGGLSTKLRLLELERRSA